jgi:O-antigen ligase
MKRFHLPAFPGWLITVAGKTQAIAWALLLITLPVTSFPYFPSGLGGRTLVRPLAVYPLLVLCLLVTIPRLLKRPLPRTFLPLLAFFTLAIISSLMSLTADIEALRGVTPVERLVRNFATLALGVAFYFTVTLTPNTWDDLRASLRWLYAGFSIALAWGSLQTLYVLHFSQTYFNLLSRIQSFISTRKLFPTRISGMTYEPKWFAEQICFLLLPWLIAMICSRRSLFDWRLKIKHLPPIQVEWVLLAWSSFVLLFTFSRTGLAILGVLVVVGFLVYRYTPSPDQGNSTVRLSKRRIFTELALLICSLITIFVVVGSQNPYFSRFWRYFTEAKKRNRTYLEFIAFDQRFTYWQTAFEMFNAYPLAGVGLGNYAFYFNEMLPDRLYRQAEIIRQTTPTEGQDRLITPKNLLARLLAETGLLGTAAFLAFVLAIVGCLIFLWLTPHPTSIGWPDQKIWALGGAFGLIVFVFTVFSTDSFAIPNMWVTFGLITAAAHTDE